VTGGLVMNSATYDLMCTIGESPTGNTVMHSANYELTTGFVGVSR
jgi:hypothetical protein